MGHTDEPANQPSTGAGAAAAYQRELAGLAFHFIIITLIIRIYRTR